MDEHGPWYRLDNAAIIMPAVSTRRGTSFFRIAMDLDHPVRLDYLDLALERIAPRFPFFMVELKRGLFWYYFQPRRVPLHAESDLGPPCMGVAVRKQGAALLRVRSRDAVLACEFSHLLTDGYGGLTFFKALLVEYFKAQGLESSAENIGIDLSAPPRQEEFEDAYQRFYRPGLPLPDPQPRVFHIPSEFLPHQRYRILSGELAVDELKAAAKAHGGSVTEFLAAIYFESLIKLREALPPRKLERANPRISLEIPVNMRQFFPTCTLRNFSLFLLPRLDTRLGPWTLDELVRFVHHYMAIENDPRRIAREIGRNAGGGRKLVVRLIPLFVKNFFARILFDALGEGLM